MRTKTRIKSSSIEMGIQIAMAIQFYIFALTKLNYLEKMIRIGCVCLYIFNEVIQSEQNRPNLFLESLFRLTNQPN